LTAGCAAKRQPPPRPRQEAVAVEDRKNDVPVPVEERGTASRKAAKARRWQEEGIASWYGKKYHGRRTSSGERYDMHGMTAAHRTLPFGTVVRVTNLRNGRTVRVTINDRGPFVDGRIIDLSYRAATELDMVRDGVAPVIVELLGDSPG